MPDKSTPEVLVTYAMANTCPQNTPPEKKKKRKNSAKLLTQKDHKKKKFKNTENSTNIEQDGV